MSKYPLLECVRKLARYGGREQLVGTTRDVQVRPGGLAESFAPMGVGMYGSIKAFNKMVPKGVSMKSLPFGTMAKAYAVSDIPFIAAELGQKLLFERPRMLQAGRTYGRQLGQENPFLASRVRAR